MALELDHWFSMNRRRTFFRNQSAGFSPVSSWPIVIPEIVPKGIVCTLNTSFLETENNWGSFLNHTHLGYNLPRCSCELTVLPRKGSGWHSLVRVRSSVMFPWTRIIWCRCWHLSLLLVLYQWICVIAVENLKSHIWFICLWSSWSLQWQMPL
jgi:hypothetical protein